MATLDAISIPTFSDVEDAAARLAGIAHVTPVMTSAHLDMLAGAQLFLKMESLQRGGAFKFRGAYNALSRLDGAAAHRGVVAFSSGNHAQAVALAGRMLGIRATIFMPSDAPAAKQAATRGYGARVILYDRRNDDREAMARRLVDEDGQTLIPPFDHPHIIAGQGTATHELIEQVGPLDRLYVPISGGGLIAGSAIAAAAMCPNCEIIGVEVAGGDRARRSLDANRIVRIDIPDTIADGAQAPQMGPITFTAVRALVHRLTTVTDAALGQAMRLCMERMKQVVEPTGCMGLAAALADAPSGARIGVITSGGNVDPAVYGYIIRTGAPA
ncbi:MAG: serine dehydratase [Sphingomonadales bacterium 32-67-7]|nr:MAG: serine dehydratase [Sphingomonadales bacterium 32-67-7]